MTVTDKVALSIEFNGHYISVLVEELVEDGRLRFTATVEGSDDGLADIRAILFDLENVELTTALSADGDDVVGSQFTVDGVLDLVDSADLEDSDRCHNDFFPFDAGVAIGTDGANSGRILSTIFTVGSSNCSLTLDDLDLDRMGVKIAIASSGKSHPRLESVGLNLGRGTLATTTDGAGDAAKLGANDFGDTFANSVGGVGGAFQAGQDEAVAGKSASVDTVDAAFAPATFKGAPLEHLSGEATIIADLGLSKFQTQDRVPYTYAQSPLGREQIGQKTAELAEAIDRSPGTGDLRNAISEKIMSHDPALKHTDVAKMAGKSEGAKTVVEQAAGSDKNLGLDFSIFIDGGSDEMLF